MADDEDGRVEAAKSSNNKERDNAMSRTLDTHGLLTTEDLCRELRLSRSGLYSRLKRRGPILTQKVGRRVYYPRDVLRSPLALPG